MGKITKQWSGLAKEYFTDADNFGMQCKHIEAGSERTYFKCLDPRPRGRAGKFMVGAFWQSMG